MPLQVRDTDLDALERLVSCITWGDIEAEDTRHLSEANFVKIFRLAQLLLEYLLYVQDNLKYTNCVLEQSRSVVAQTFDLCKPRWYLCIVRVPVANPASAALASWC